MNIIGKTRIKNALIIDDIIDTGGTVIQASELLEKVGCESIIVLATHGLFSGQCISRIMESPIDKVIVSNSISIKPERKFPKLEIISAAPILAEAITRIHKEESISSLFEF